MAGAGVEVKLDEEYQKIVDALRKASAPNLQRIAQAAGLALRKVSRESFANETDPATGSKWAPLKNPRGELAKNPGSTSPVLTDRGTLRRSINFNAFSDGSVIIGSNLVYARIHQEGGRTKAHDIKPRNKRALRFLGIYRKLVRHPGSDIPARPFLGVPKDFERQFFDDPAIKEALGMAGGS
jgi:phage virion morphogenesis protein